MNREQAFLAAICEAPHDPLPRLAYADWLEERGGPGDADRAAFWRSERGEACARLLKTFITVGAALGRIAEASASAVGAAMPRMAAALSALANNFLAKR
jgi:uncharacterized protein (TIGR02996 family)